MDPLREFLSPRTLADMENDVIRRGGSFDVPFGFDPGRPKPKKQKKEKQ